MKKLGRLTVVAIFAVLFAVLFMSALRLNGRMQTADVAVENLRYCREIAAKIEALNEAPAQASLGESASDDLVRQVESAAMNAGIPEQGLLRISPESGRRIGDTAYLEQPTRVLLRNVSLRELFTFLKEATASTGKLTVTAILLTAPIGDSSVKSDSERWSAEVTLTQLVFSPQSRRSTS